DDAEAARERASVLDLHERAHTVEGCARTADAGDRADVAGDERRRLLRAPADDGHVLRQAGEPAAGEVGAAAGHVDAPVGAGGAGGGLAALCERLVRDATAADHGDVRLLPRTGGRVTVREQAFTDLV